ncbi:MAG: DUF4159 domain-containing protein [Acidobacteria bacterium]|nr:DUF4159 domain-containing protein [Acidobacteriota bacterium]
MRRTVGWVRRSCRSVRDGRRWGARRAAAVTVALALAGVTVVSAQSLFRGLGNWGRIAQPYDAEVTFVRLRWTQGTLGAQTYGRGVNMWLHEFPRAEQFLMGLLRDFTTVDAKVDGSLILTLDDPALFQHPIALMQEPGFWTMTDEEAGRLREYLLKGGFVIFNDFEGRQWENFEAQVRRVLPDGRWLRLDPTHRIFDSFFLVEQIDLPNPYNHHLAGLTPEFFGLFENNDPTGRLMSIANYNTNLAEYWQSGGTGFFPIEPMNNGFELGINYWMYGLTH